MIVDYTLQAVNEAGENRPELKRRVPNVPAELEGKVRPKYRSETDDFELIPTKEYQEELKEEKLLQEFDQKLEQRVNQIAEAVASGARGQELADKMRKK